jgi:hypothetical protein
MAQPPDISRVLEARQGEQRLPVTAQPASFLPGAAPAAAGGRLTGNELNQLRGHVEHDSIEDHAAPLPVAACSLARLLLPGIRVSGHLRVCPRVCLNVPLSYVCPPRPY